MTIARMLIALFSKTEFHDALFEMKPDKCLGLDELNLKFYQHFWLLVILLEPPHLEDNHVNRSIL